MRQHKSGLEDGFTVLEVVFWGAVLFVVGAIVVGIVNYAQNNRKVTGTWRTHPATVSQLPANGTFVWNITTGSAVSKANRNTIFSAACVPTPDGAKIYALNGVLKNPPDVTGTSATDQSGDVQVIVGLDCIGSASLTALDTTTGAKEQVTFTGVQ